MEGLSVLKPVVSTVAGIAFAGAFSVSSAFADGGYPLYGGAPSMKDEVVYAPPPIVWSGFYLGLHAGYGWGNSDWKALTDIFDPILAGDRLSHDPDGGLVGGHIGYNFQAGRFVFGIEGTLSGTNIEEKTVTDFGFAIDPVHLRTEINTMWTVTGRLGYDWGRLLTYVKAGYAGADVETSARDFLNFRVTDSQTHHGWTVGGGIEYLASENLILGVEYNYYDFGSEDYGRWLPWLETDRLVRNDVDLHTVTARVSYKIGPRRVAAEPLPPLK